MTAYNGDLYLGLNGAEVLLSPFGRKFTISDVEISRSERTASGKLVRDIVATKKKFKLSYSEIDGDALEDFLDLYDIKDELSFLVYELEEPATTTEEPTVSYTQYTVLMEPIDRERLLLCGPDHRGMWTNVTVELNEV